MVTWLFHPMQRTKGSAVLAAVMVTLVPLGGFLVAQDQVASAATSVQGGGLPVPVDLAAHASDGHAVYLFGGRTGSSATNAIQRYDFVTGAAEILPQTLPAARYGAAAVWTGSEFLLFGVAGAVQRFDPGTGIFRASHAGAIESEGIAAVWTGSLAYVFTNTDVLSYDPVSDTLVHEVAYWRSLQARMYFSAVWDGRYAYMFGGEDMAAHHFGPFGEILRYDPDSDQVTGMQARLPSPRGYTAAAWDGTYAYIFGGAVESGYTAGYTADVVRYDPRLDRAVVVDSLPSPRIGMAAAQVGSSTFLLGGVGPAWTGEVLRWTDDFTNAPLSLGTDEVVEPTYVAAQDGAGCAEGRGGNTLGFTTCAAGLDAPLGPGSAGGAAVDVGDFAAFYDFRPPRPVRLAIDAQVSVRQEASAALVLADVHVNKQLQGTLVVEQGTRLCLRPKAGDACARSLEVPGEVVHRGANEVRVQLRDAASFQAAGVTHGPQLTISAVALQLAAPPTFILHGGTPPPPIERPEECPPQSGSFPAAGDRPASSTAPWRQGLADALRERARATLGQDPWAYDIESRRPGSRDSDPALNPYWTYCGQASIVVVAGQFQQRLTELEDDGYGGKAWVVAHSMGGLVTRFHEEIFPKTASTESRVSRLVMMGTPNRGFCLALAAAGVGGLWSGGGSPVRTAEQLLLQQPYLQMVPDSLFLRILNGVGRAEEMDYLALSGEIPAIAPGLCDLGLRRVPQVSDGLVPAASSRFDGGHAGARTFTVVTEVCTPHDHIPGVPEGFPPYFESESSIGHIAEWLFFPHAPYDGPVHEPTDCSAFLRAKKAAVSWLEGLWDAGQEQASHIVDAGHQGLLDLLRRLARLPPILQNPGSLAASAAPEAGREVVLHGGNATVTLFLPPGEDRLVLELGMPDGGILLEQDERPWLRRETTDHGHVVGRSWHLDAGPPGAWQIRVRGPAESGAIPFSILVEEDGPGPLTASADREAYAPGGTAVLSARLEDALDVHDVQVVVQLRGPGGTRSRVMAPDGAGTFHLEEALDGTGITTATLRATGVGGSGASFERVASVELVVPPRVDREVRGVGVGADYAWRGEPLTAVPRVCSVGPEDDPAGGTLLVMQGGRLVGAPAVDLPAVGECVEVLVSWLASPGEGVEARVAGLSPDLAPTNDVSTHPLHVADAPATRAALDGAAGRDGWFVSPVQVALAPYDGSEPLPMAYALDGAGSHAYDAPFVVADDGRHVLTFQATDPVLQEIEPLRSAPFAIDTTPPTTRVEPVGPFHENEEGLHVGPRTLLVLDASDAASGVHATWGGEPGATRLGAEARSLTGASRATEFLTWSEDVAGNVETARRFPLRFDADPPVSRLEVQPAAVDGHLTSASWVAPSAHDPRVSGVASGLARTWCRITGPAGLVEQRDACSTPFRLQGDDGLYRIAFGSVDLVGNEEPEQVLELRLDNTAPVGELVEPAPASIVISEPGVAVGTDMDGDGFADAMERAAGSEPGLNLSIPGSTQLLANPGFEGAEGLRGWTVTASPGMGVMVVPENSPWTMTLPPRLPAAAAALRDRVAEVLLPLIGAGEGGVAGASEEVAAIVAGDAANPAEVAGIADRIARHLQQGLAEAAGDSEPEAFAAGMAERVLVALGLAEGSRTPERSAAEVRGGPGILALEQALTGAGGFRGVAFDLHADQAVEAVEVEVQAALPGQEPTTFRVELEGEAVHRDRWQRVVLPASSFEATVIPLLPLQPVEPRTFTLRFRTSVPAPPGSMDGPTHDVAHARIDNVRLFTGPPLPASEPSPPVIVGPWLNVSVRGFDPPWNGVSAGVGSVDLLLDGAVVAAVPLRTSEGWTWTVNVSTASAGTHVLELGISDALGHGAADRRQILLFPATPASVRAMFTHDSEARAS